MAAAAFGVAVALIAIAVRWNGSPVMPAFCWLAVTGIVLAIVDIRFHRLPHYLVGAMGSGGLMSLVVADPAGLVRALGAVVIAAGGLFLVGVFSRGQVGFGDVTLCAAVALYLGWLGWRHLILGLLTACLLAAAVGTFLIVTRRARLQDPLPFGPMLISGGLIALSLP
nr:prepilin peptidase [Kibdelosporangium sp. MJ126-NF4]CEL17630.1 putative type IV peptidase [Kibdelosporangium sp. MJ126-NF4]CTQ91142.1 putative type IV peptidase [Kibdelosporangium sp. MJ126-NF4]